MYTNKTNTSDMTNFSQHDARQQERIRAQNPFRDNSRSAHRFSNSSKNSAHPSSRKQLLASEPSASKAAESRFANSSSITSTERPQEDKRRKYREKRLCKYIINKYDAIPEDQLSNKNKTSLEWARQTLHQYNTGEQQDQKDRLEKAVHSMVDQNEETTGPRRINLSSVIEVYKAVKERKGRNFNADKLVPAISAALPSYKSAKRSATVTKQDIPNEQTNSPQMVKIAPFSTAASPSYQGDRYSVAGKREAKMEHDQKELSKKQFNFSSISAVYKAANEIDRYQAIETGARPPYKPDATITRKDVWEQRNDEPLSDYTPFPTGQPQTTQSRTSDDNTHLIRAVIDRSNSEGAITEYKWKLVEVALLKVFLDVMEKNPGPPPVCRDAGWYQNNIKLVDCADLRSVMLYEQAISQVGELWQDCNLQVVCLYKIPKRPRTKTWIPIQPADPNAVLQLIQTSNPSLPTYDWKVVKVGEIEGRSRQAVIIINERSLAPLAHTKGVINYGFNSITLNVCDRK